MNVFKSKSLHPSYSDREIETGCHSVSFISFERAIRETLEFNKGANSRPNEKPIGYRVTEQGIDIIWE